MNFQYFLNLFEINLFNDSKLVFSDGSINVSRMILAGHCEYFFNLFTKDPKQTKFNINDLNLTDFKVYYEYIHSGIDFIVTGDKIMSLIRIQKKLNASNIKSELDNWMHNKSFTIYQGIFFEATNVFEYQEYNNIARKMISTNFKALYEIKAFDSFSRFNFMSLFNPEFIKDKDQKVILDIITRWVEYDFNKRNIDWLDLILMIDYSKIERSVLKEYVQKNEKVFSMPDLIKFLYAKIDVVKQIKHPVKSNVPSKMLLFGGHDSQQSVVQIDIKSKSVKTIGTLSIPKYNHCCEKIRNNVFVLGDENSKEIEKFNLEVNKSQILSFKMKTPNLFYSSAAISNKIYVIGGKSNGQSINTVEYFEVEKMTWINGPKLLQKIRSHDSIVVDGIIYAVGDLESKKFQRLDEREGKWTFLPDILNLTCNTALSAFGQTLTCAGSWTAPSPGAVVNGISESFCQIYDIRNSKWNQMTKLVVPVWGAKSIENETSIFVAGGLNNLTIQEYNKNNKLWAILNIKLPSMKHRCSKIVL